MPINFFPDGDITIKLKYSDKKIIVKIIDHGAPFSQMLFQRLILKNI